MPAPLTPLVAIHLATAITATLLGPAVLWARKGRTQRPALHRTLGYAWVGMMLTAALSALFIRDFRLPNIAGFTPLHLLVPVTLLTLAAAFRYLARGNIRGHRLAMQQLYIGACLVAGGFALMPGRYLGHLLWSAFP